MKAPLADRLIAVFRRPIFKRLTLYSASASISQVIMMVYGILVARQLNPDNFGLFASSYAAVGITIFLVNWGMDTWMLREGGKGVHPERLSGTVLQTKLMIGTLWVILLVGLLPLIRPALFPRLLVLVAALDQLFDSITITTVSGLNIAKRTERASWVMLVTRGGRLIGAVLLILLTRSQSPIDYASFRLLATILGGGVGLLLLRPILGFASMDAPVSILRTSFSYGLAEMLSMVYAQVDVTLLGLFTNVSQVGQYSPAVSLINAMSIVPASVFYIVVPILTNAYLTNRQRFTTAILQTLLLYGLIGIVLAGGTALLLSNLLTIFLGEKYISTGRFVLTMSPILLFKSLSFAGATYLVVAGQHKKRILVQLISALLNVGMNIVFIPLYGPIGAAVTFVVSESILTIGYLGISFYYFRNIKQEQFAGE